MSSSTDVSTFEPASADYRAVKTGEDALDLARRILGIGPDDVIPSIADTELSDGFEVMPTDNKDTLIGKPFLIMDWSFYEGSFGPAVAVRIITNTGDKWIINDGSTGIKSQLAMLGAPSVFLVPGGLRASRYMYEDDKGQQRPAVTHYLSTAATATTR